MATKDQILHKFALAGDRVVLKEGAEFDPEEKVHVVPRTGALVAAREDGSEWIGATTDAPRRADSPCRPGDTAQDERYVYLCVRENTWQRGTLKSWE